MQRTQRKMLRMILGEKRRQITTSSDEGSSGHDVASNPEEVHPDGAEEYDNNDNEEQLEDWVEWIRRVTHRVENQMSKLKLEPWIAKARRIKWRWGRWAQRLLSEPSKDKWSARSLQWDPEFVSEGVRTRAYRTQGRPRTRCADDFTKYAQKILDDVSTSWSTLLRTPDFWKNGEDSFVKNNV